MTGDDEAWQDYLDTPEFDVRDDDDDENRHEPPLAGCACEGAIIVDTTCASCIDYLRQRDEETNGVPGSIPSREMDDVSTVDQCQRCLRPVAECKCPKGE